MPVTSQHYEQDAELSLLSDHPQNPRRGDDPSVAASVNGNGWYGAIIAQRSTGHILAGHTRRRVLAAAGRVSGPVMWVDCDDDTALRILLADNRTAELATWDEAELSALLREVAPGDLAAVGFTADDMTALGVKLAAADVGTVDANAVWEQTGMPGYESNDVMPVFTTSVHFRTEADADEFFATVHRPRARSWWWPEDDGFVGTLSDMHGVATPVDNA